MRPLVDDLDRAILSYLYKDGRVSCSEIARRVGYVSVRTVNNRIRRLTKKGIIKIRAVVMPRALGYDVNADIAIEVEPGKAKEVAEELLKIDEVCYIATITGESDLDIAAYTPDISDLQILIHERIQRIPGVRRTKTYIITEMLIRSPDWEVPTELPRRRRIASERQGA